jgi:hypothetical protein
MVAATASRDYLLEVIFEYDHKRCKMTGRKRSSEKHLKSHPNMLQNVERYREISESPAMSSECLEVHVK